MARSDVRVGTPRSLAGGIAEYFTLARARSLQARMSAEQRALLAKTLKLAEQRSDAADTLWSNGHAAEGLRLMSEAIDEIVLTIDRVASALEPRSTVSEPAEPAAEPARDAIREPAAEPAPDPTREPAGEPTREPAGEPTREPAPEPIPEPTPERAGEAAPEPTPEPMPDPTREAAPEPTRERAREPAREPAPEPGPRATPEPETADLVRLRALVEVGLSRRDADFVCETAASYRALSLPKLDEHVSQSHVQAYERMARTLHIVVKRVGPLSADPRRLRWVPLVRAVTSVLVLAAAIIVYRVATQRPPIEYEASGVWANADAFTVEKAFDGRAETWWIGPDGVESWIEVRFAEGHRVERVRFLNATNPPHHDRGLARYRLEVHGEDGVLRRVEGEVPQSTTQEWTEVALGLAEVRRIRLVALSHRGLSPAVAELVWE